MSGGSCDGLLLVDKPAGITSHDVVARVRRGCGVRRVGHAGTLDPMATGLLPLVLGRATRLVRFLPHSPKTYNGTLRLGCTTTTDDRTGQALTRHAGPLPTAEEVTAAARRFLGAQSQIPPDVSARRIDGQRLYELARQGAKIEAPASVVQVSRFELQPTPQPAIYEFTAEVSVGTYIRALARDLGRALGCGGVLESLERTRIGPMTLSGARSLPADGPDPSWLREALVPLEQMPLEMSAVRLSDADQARRFSMGQALPGLCEGQAAGRVRVFHPSGELLGIADGRDETLYPCVVLAGPS